MGKKSVVGKTADQLVKSGGARLWLYSPPFLTWASLPAVGGLLYAATTSGRGPAMGVASLLTLTTAGLPGFTWHAYSVREKSIRIHATATAAGMCLWTDLAAGLGLANWPVWIGWGVIGVGALTWGIRRIAAPKETTTSEPTAFEKAVAGAKLGKPKVVEGRVVAKVVANRGEESIKDVQARANTIGAAMGVRPGAVRITPDPDDAGAGQIVIITQDPLKTPQPWPGPSHPGASIADYPIPVGPNEDGTITAVWLCGDQAAHRNLVHWLVMGMNGAGKSDGWCNIITDALTRCDVEVWGSDHVKQGQTFGPIADYMTKVATTVKEGKQLLADANAERARRQADFANRTPMVKQWGKGCGYPLLIVWLEEAADLVSDTAAFTKLVKECRSAGIVVIVSLQLAKHDQLDTTARSQLAGTSCFGVRDSSDAGFALPDDIIDAGAAPENWGNRRPGYSYWVADGVPEELWSTPTRTFLHDADQAKAVLAEHANPRPVGDRPKPAPPAEAEADDDEEAPLPDLDPDLHVDPDEPVEAPDFDDVPFARPAKVSRSTGEAQAIVQQHLRTLLAAGTTSTQPADLFAMRPETGRSKEWVRKELGRLCTEPAAGEIGLERDDDDPPGVFRILAPVSAGV